METSPASPVQATLFDAASHDGELRLVLQDAARRAGAEGLAPVLADVAIRATRGADTAVTLDAMGALVRRLSSADAYAAVKRKGQAPGCFEVRQRGRQEPRYEVWFADLARLDGSCGCRDFAKAALGVCKHMLAAAMRYGGRPPRPEHRLLRWDPVRPLTGPGDWIERVWCDPRATARAPHVRALFSEVAPGHTLDRSLLGSVDRRLATVRALRAACRRNPELAEPALARLLEEEAVRLGQRDPKLGTDRELARALRGLKQTLFPYQRSGVAKFLTSERLLLADDMGLGKTAQAIAGCHALATTDRISRALIVVPASLKPQWAREWRAFTPLELVTVDGHPEERAAIYRRPGPAILLVNYEQLLRDLPLVQAFAPELVILDEAQRIKNWQTKTAQVIKQLEPRWRLVLTGTPMENRLDELASIMEWVDEGALEPRWRLASWHAIRADGRREVVGARNLDTLRLRLAPSMLRRIRREVLDQLPPRRDAHVPVMLTEEQTHAHSQLEMPIASIVAQARRRPLTQAEFLRLMRLFTEQRMICNGLALRDFRSVWPDIERSRRDRAAVLATLGSPKLLELRDRIADLVLTQERKVVVFSQWRRMLQLSAWACEDLLARAGLRAVFFTGQESQKRRTQNIIDFHDDPSTRILFATDAGGVGLNLQRAASCCINLELPWNPAVLEQRIGRVFRLGQTQPVDVYNLIAASGIEARIAGLVGDKKALFTGLFDGTSDEVPFDSAGSFLNQLEKLAPEVAAPVAGPVSPEDVDDLDDVDAIDDIDDIDVIDRLEGEPGELPDPAVADPGMAAAVLDVAALTSALAEVTIRPAADGRVAVEVPAPLAGALGGLLRSLATLIESGSGRSS